MSRINKRFAFTRLRAEYYTAGRLLCFCGCPDAAVIMLGYAIEMHFKAGLHELHNKKRIQFKRKLLRSHELDTLLVACQKEKLFTDVEVSSEFIDYANDHLHWRYPTHQEEVYERLNEQKRANFFSLGYTLPAYDDFICQLDDELVVYTDDPFISVIAHAACQAWSHSSRVFFHYNAPALSRLEGYTEAIRKHRAHLTKAIAILEKGAEILWELPSLQKIPLADSIESVLAKRPAANFRYSRDITEELIKQRRAKREK